MTIAIIDCRLNRCEKIAALFSAHFQVKPYALISQTYDVEFPEWDDIRSTLIDFARHQTCIFLHCGEDQPDWERFVLECCKDVPVLGYTGGAKSPEAFRQSPLHVLYPGVVDKPGLTVEQTRAFYRWAESIAMSEELPIDERQTVIAKAVKVVRGFDEALEDQLEDLIQAVSEASGQPYSIEVFQKLLAKRKGYAAKLGE